MAAPHAPADHGGGKKCERWLTMPPHELARSPEAIAHFKAEVEEKVLSSRDGGLFVLLDTRSRPIIRSGIGLQSMILVVVGKSPRKPQNCLQNCKVDQ